MADETRTELSRDLGVFTITMVGVSAMIGAGFVLTGIAAGTAGPALVLPYAANGLVTFLTAFSGADREGWFRKLIFGTIPQRIAKRATGRLVLVKRRRRVRRTILDTIAFFRDGSGEEERGAHRPESTVASWPLAGSFVVGAAALVAAWLGDGRWPTARGNRRVPRDDPRRHLTPGPAVVRQRERTAEERKEADVPEPEREPAEPAEER